MPAQQSHKMVEKALEDSKVLPEHTIKVVIETVDQHATVKLNPNAFLKDADVHVVTLDKHVTGKEASPHDGGIEIKHEEVHVTEVKDNFISKQSTVNEIESKKGDHP